MWITLEYCVLPELPKIHVVAEERQDDEKSFGSEIKLIFKAVA